MILAVDVGNTHMVLGAMEGEKVLHFFRAATDPRLTSDQLAVTLKMFLDLYGMNPESFEGAILSSVVPGLNKPFCKAIRLIFGCEPLVLGAGVKTGLNIMIDNPAELGADLVAGAVAALHRFQPPIILFDLGTATTISVLDKQGRYLGGSIMMGVMLGLNALSNGTSQLPHIGLSGNGKCIGTNTVDCMRSGSLFGTASMMDGMVERIEAELGSSATVVATGGLASDIVPYCRHKITVDDDLLLVGLSVIFQRNKK